MQPQRQTVQSTAWWLTKWWWGDKRRQEWHKQELKVKYCLGINVVFSSPKLLKMHCAHCLLSLPVPHFPNSLHLISTSAATKTVFFCVFFWGLPEIQLLPSPYIAHTFLNLQLWSVGSLSFAISLSNSSALGHLAVWAFSQYADSTTTISYIPSLN